MEPIAPTPLNRVSAFGVGFLVGIGAQILFRMLVLQVIGPVSVLLSSRTAALVAILLAPIILSLLFVRITPDSVSEDFLHGFQLGSLVWLVITIFAIF